MSGVTNVSLSSAFVPWMPGKTTGYIPDQPRGSNVSLQSPPTKEGVVVDSKLGLGDLFSLGLRVDYLKGGNDSAEGAYVTAGMSDAFISKGPFSLEGTLQVFGGVFVSNNKVNPAIGAEGILALAFKFGGSNKIAIGNRMGIGLGGTYTQNLATGPLPMTTVHAFPLAPNIEFTHIF